MCRAWLPCVVYPPLRNSEADLQSISSVGASGKTSDASTIGKYGLGFNVAYHLSEVYQHVACSSSMNAL